MKRKKNPPVFRVINWDINRNDIDYYDIMPYLIDQYKKEKVKPKTFDEVKKFIHDESLCQFWSRCQYEVIVSSWPPRKDSEKKIDVFSQIEQNIDVISNLFLDYIS